MTGEEVVVRREVISKDTGSSKEADVIGGND